jgi:hypothetical protein
VTEKHQAEVLGAIRRWATRVKGLRIAGEAAIDDVWPSDHAAVVAELELPHPRG